MEIWQLFLAFLIREVPVSRTQGISSTLPPSSTYAAVSSSDASASPNSTTAGIAGTTLSPSFETMRTTNKLTSSIPNESTSAFTDISTPAISGTLTPASPTTLFTTVPDNISTTSPTTLFTTVPDNISTTIPTTLFTTVPDNISTTSPTTLFTTVPDNISTTIPTTLFTTVPDNISTTIPTTLFTTVPDNISTTIPTTLFTTVPDNISTTIPTTLFTTVPDNISTTIPTSLFTTVPDNISTTIPTSLFTTVPDNISTTIPTSLFTTVPDNISTTIPTTLFTTVPDNISTTIPTSLFTTVPDNISTTIPTSLFTTVPDNISTTIPTSLFTTVPDNISTTIPTSLFTTVPDNISTTIPTTLFTTVPDNISTTIPTTLFTTVPDNISTTIPTTLFTTVPDNISTTSPDNPTTATPDLPTTTLPDDTTPALLSTLSPIIPSSPTTALPPPPAPTTSFTSTTALPPPPAPTTSFTSTHAPLDCTNGQEVNGVCLCLDEWAGENCEKPNFCDGTIKDGFSFSKTVIGRFSYSNELCPEETTNAGAPRASAQCLDNSSFGQVQKLDCGLTLNDLQQNIPGNLANVATNVQILTSQPQRLTPENITTAAEIVTELLESTPTEEVAVAAVSTVSQLLNANFTAGSTVDSSATNRLTTKLEQFSLRQGEDSTIVVQPNLVVQSVKGLGRISQGVEFIAKAGLSDQFAASRIHLNTSTDQLSDDTTVPVAVQIFLPLQPGSESAPIGFVLYQNDQLFQSVRFKTPRNTTRRVISASRANGARLGRVEMRFSNTSQNVSSAVLHDFACVFWDYTVKDWSTEGCWKHRSPIGSLGCTCNHTTNFAVLMSFRHDYRYAEELSWISIVGCSLSVAGVSMTIIFHIITRKSRKTNVTVLTVSICFSLLIVYLLFLFGVNNTAPAAKKDNVLLLSDEHPEHDRGGCTAITALLQYFLLATFTWNLLYATQIFLLIYRPFAQNPRPFTVAALVTGWGLPAVIVGVTLAVTYRPQHPLDYRQEEFCWLAALDRENKMDLEKPMFWGFLLPVALMLLFNCVILVYFMDATCKTDPKLESTKIGSPMKKILSSFSLSVILGLSWILGYLLLISTNNYMLTIVFCIFTTTQGLQIFILFVVRTPPFKAMASKLLPSLPAPEIALHHKKFSLWRRLWTQSHESYKQTEDQSTSQF